MSWEHHAVLLISEVLKGNTSITSMPIAIHYGLEPAVGGVVSNQAGLFMDARMGSTNYPKDVIEILDSGRPGGRVASDIRMDHIWFLHRQPQERHDSDMIGVFDPEDIQPMDRKQAILKLIK